MNSLAGSARWAAAHRARETEKPNALFKDPYARALAGEEGVEMLRQAEAENPQHQIIASYMVIRTRFFDDLMVRAVERGIRQVVLLAAGMDCRAFRFPWPSDLNIYEIDQPEIVELKTQLLQEQNVKSECKRVALPVMLGDNWDEALLAAGFSPTQPTLWCAEGIVCYLPEEKAMELLNKITAMSAPGSMIGADMISHSYLVYPGMKQVLEILEQRGLAWRYGHDEPEKLLAGKGWNVVAAQPGEQGANYGRWLMAPPPRGRGYPHMFLVSGDRTA
jgi:methyltransferase (TIGR00027 family)